MSEEIELLNIGGPLPPPPHDWQKRWRELEQRASKLEIELEMVTNDFNRERKRASGLQITGETSDGYHTFNELYEYRKVYNALLFNEWAASGKYGVHKSWKHSDGEPCFGGGWFIVVATLSTGQVSNHYKSEDWDLFRCQERVLPDAYDGHTPQIALERFRLELIGRK